MILQFHNLALLGAILGLSLSPFCSAEVNDIYPDTPISSLIASAKAARARGANGDALAYFDAAATRNPADYLTLFQRGATYLAMGRNAQANADFDSVLRIRPDFEGALLQRGKLKARNADWPAARKDFKTLGNKGKDEMTQLDEAEGAALLAVEAEKKQDWESCINHAGVAIMTAGTSLSLRQLRARCRFERGEIQEGVSDLAHVLQIDPGQVQPHLQISAMLFYSLGDLDRGLAQMKKCLHSDPDSKPCKLLYREQKTLIKTLDKVKSQMSSRQFSSAVKQLVPSAIHPEDEPGVLSEIKTNEATHRTSGIIYPKAPSDLYNSFIEKTCEAYMGTNNMNKAGQYCTETLQTNPHSLSGLLYRVQQQMDAEDYEAAIRTLNEAKDHHPTEAQHFHHKLHEAQTALKRSKQKDYYKILGVGKDADERTIKKAYRTATKIHHPDKAVAKGTSKEEAEKQMAAINEAYEVLSDPELKARFDNGEDPNDPMANQGGPFQQGGHPFGHGGQGGQQFFFQQGGFPGGGAGGGRTFKFSAGGGGGGFAGFPGF